MFNIITVAHYSIAVNGMVYLIQDTKSTLKLGGLWNFHHDIKKKNVFRNIIVSNTNVIFFIADILLLRDKLRNNRYVHFLRFFFLLLLNLLKKKNN